MKNVYLFTESYPFGCGEQFIEKELLVASEMDEIRIVVIPLNISHKQRKLPKGIELNTSLAYANRKRTNFLPTLGSISLLLYGLSMHKINSFIDIFRIAKFVHIACVAQKWAKKNLSSVEDLILYTYWCREVTVGLCQYINKINKAIPLVSRLHGWDLYEERHRNNFIPFRKYLLDSNISLLPVSNNGKKYLELKYKNHNCFIGVSKLGISNEFSSVNKGALENIHLVSCSFIVPVKRLELLADSVIYFADNNQEVSIQWTHIGDGPDKQEILDILKVRKPINFNYNFLGHLSNTDIFKFYNSVPITAFINVSESEGIPVSIMEAMSFGIPVIATNVGGTSEIVNETNGVLISPNPSIEEISSVINLLKDTALWSEKRIQAKRTWETKFNSELNYKAFYEFLIKIGTYQDKCTKGK